MEPPWPHVYGEVSFYIGVLVAGIGLLLQYATGQNWPFLFCGIAGAILLLRSYLMLSNYRGTLDYLREQAPRTSPSTWIRGTMDGQLGGVVCAFFGIVFLLMGLGAFQ